MYEEFLKLFLLKANIDAKYLNIITSNDSIIIYNDINNIINNQENDI